MSTHSPPVAAVQNRLDEPSASSGTNGLAVQDSDCAALIRGLSAQPAMVSPKYLYDSLGSKLFEAVCLLAEYYPTRTEAEIMRSNLADIANTTGQGMTLIDLGAGNCEKAEKLFPALEPAHYVAVDISSQFLCAALNRLQSVYPHISMTALGQDFSHGLNLPSSVPQVRRLFFYPGSSLGNFAPPEASRFLQGLRTCGGDDAALLLGIDLVKDHNILNAAYNDTLGITSAFNLNLLRNVNRVLGANFNVADWRHVAYFNEQASRIEMHLEALRSVNVAWPDGNRQFHHGERIHTENSYKYTYTGLATLMQESGWQINEFWTDPNSWFAVVYASCAGRASTEV